MGIEPICEGTPHTTVLKTARHTSYPFTSTSILLAAGAVITKCIIWQTGIRSKEKLQEFLNMLISKKG